MLPSFRSAPFFEGDPRPAIPSVPLSTSARKTVLASALVLLALPAAASGQTPGEFAEYGTGCSGFGTSVPLLTVSALPNIGARYPLHLTRATPSSPSVLSFGGSSLNFDLSLLGAPGCAILASSDRGSIAPHTDALGSVEVSLLIPDLATLLGYTFHNQFLVLSPGANPLGIIASNGGTTEIGKSPLCVAFSALADGDSNLVTGTPKVLNYSTKFNEGGAWSGSVFKAPVAGVYYFFISAVKDTTHGGTGDDVFIDLMRNGTVLIDYAWSGAGDGQRGTLELSTAVSLDAGDKITTVARSQNNRPWEIQKCALSGFLINTRPVFSGAALAGGHTSSGLPAKLGYATRAVRGPAGMWNAVAWCADQRETGETRMREFASPREPIPAAP